jgi:hypothetical protein
VILVPARSEVLPAEADTRTRLTRKIPLNVPIASSARGVQSANSTSITAVGAKRALTYLRRSTKVNIEKEDIKRAIDDVATHLKEAVDKIAEKSSEARDKVGEKAREVGRKTGDQMIEKGQKLKAASSEPASE